MVSFVGSNLLVLAVVQRYCEGENGKSVRVAFHGCVTRKRTNCFDNKLIGTVLCTLTVSVVPLPSSVTCISRTEFEPSCQVVRSPETSAWYVIS